MADHQPLDETDPARLGAYRVMYRLGEGGQGVVYLAESDSGLRVAIKLFHAAVSGDLASSRIFERELDIAKQVARWSTAQVLDSGLFGSRPYIVSEYVPGPSLHQVVTDEGPVRGSTLERLAINTITALMAIHDAGIVHRDFKPHNVLLGQDGPRVIDFGIARTLASTTTDSHAAVGSPAFMAPEQFATRDIGPKADVFAWASVIAYAATGRMVFGNDTIPQVMFRVLNEDADLDGVDEPLRTLLAACMAKDPEARPSAPQVHDHLVRGTVPSPPSGAGVSSARRGRWFMAAVAAAVTIVSAGAALVVAQGGIGEAAGGDSPRSAGTSVPTQGPTAGITPPKPHVTASTAPGAKYGSGTPSTVSVLHLAGETIGAVMTTTEGQHIERISACLRPGKGRITRLRLKIVEWREGTGNTSRRVDGVIKKATSARAVYRTASRARFISGRSFQIAAALDAGAQKRDLSVTTGVIFNDEESFKSHDAQRRAYRAACTA